MSEPFVAVRTWKRDGSRNTMPLAVAAANLAASLGTVTRLTKEDYLEGLRRGNQYTTRLAVFRRHRDGPR